MKDDELHPAKIRLCDGACNGRKLRKNGGGPGGDECVVQYAGFFCCCLPWARCFRLRMAHIIIIHARYAERIYGLQHLA